MPRQQTIVCLPWWQLFLRSLALSCALTTLIIGVYVALNIHRRWTLVFISTMWVIFTDTAETTILSSLRSRGSNPILRIHPGVLIGMDSFALCLLVWSIWWLVLDSFNPLVGMVPYVADPWRIVALWMSVGICGLHFVLIFFSCLDSCLERKLRMREEDDGIDLG